MEKLQPLTDKYPLFMEYYKERIGLNNIYEILLHASDNHSLRRELYDLVVAEDKDIGYHAAWILTHLSREENKWLYDKQNELIDVLLACNHGGKRRVVLNLLYKQPLTNPLRVDFLDFCFDRMSSVNELPAVKSLCMKIAYELCLPIPELMQELKTTLEMMEGELSPAIRSVRKSILKAIPKAKSLQRL